MGATDVTLPSTITPPSGITPKFGTSGVAITAGQCLYRDPTDNTIKKAIGSSANAAKAIGFALASTPAVGQIVPYFDGGGDLSSASGLTAGEPYFVSDTTAGAIMKASDLGTGDYVTYVGTAKSATVFTPSINASGVAHA